jgi:hypothetical protein
VKLRLLSGYLGCVLWIFGGAFTLGVDIPAVADDKDCRLMLVEMESRLRAVMSEVEILRGSIRLCGDDLAVMSLVGELRAQTSKLVASTVIGGGEIASRSQSVMSLAKVEAVLPAERVVIVSMRVKPDFRDGQVVRLGVGSFVSRVVDTRVNSVALQLSSPAFDSLAVKVGQSVYVY